MKGLCASVGTRSIIAALTLMALSAPMEAAWAGQGGMPVDAPVEAEPLPPPPSAAGAGPGPATSSSPPITSESAGAEGPRAEIAWRVDNPFRFFRDRNDTEVHRATWLALSPEERATPILSSERALARREPEGWAEQMVEHTCWNAARNRYECGEKNSYLSPESHRVVAALTGVEGDVECTWLTAPLGGKRLRGVVLKRPCGSKVRFEVPYPKGLRVSAEIGGREVAATEIRVRDILIGAMGDSFGSGEGNPDVAVRFSRERSVDYGKAEKSPEMLGYPARVGTWQQVGDRNFVNGNARWLDTACRRSLYSHQLRAALQLSLEDPHRAVTFVGLACSGAEVTWGLFLRYKGNEWVPNPPDLSQISALAVAQCGSRTAPAQDFPEAFHMGGVVKELMGGLVLRRCAQEDSRPIDILMVSIGGNDIGFARLVANAVLSDSSLVRQLGGWFGQVHGNHESEALLDALDERYKSLNRAVHAILHVPWGESDRIILTAYPPLALLGDGSKVCPDGPAGMDVLPEFALSRRTARESTELADEMQEVMAKSAELHSWSFATRHRDAFVGRGICAGYTDNAFSIADDLRLPRMRNDRWEPYNPADYMPYATRQRWFRTPNDAFLTGNFHVAGSTLQKVLKLDTFSWFQVLLASTYSGAFHPNAEGQAAIADSVAEKARQVLDKYGQSSGVSPGSVP